MKGDKHLQLISFKPENYVIESANLIGQFIQLLIKEKTQISIALSGGNSPLPIYKKLSLLELDWDRIKFFLVDERCVSISDPQSNYGNIEKRFFSMIPSKSYPMVTYPMNFKEQALEYQNKIKLHVPLSKGIPQFDLIILGMGLDGHTASLFPNTKALKNRNDLVVLNEVPQLQTERITMTYPLLENAKNIILIAPGNEKKKVLTNLNKNKHPITRLIPKIEKILN